MVIYIFSIVEDDGSQAEHEIFGKVKVLANRKGLILNATIVAAHAGELILPFVVLNLGH